MKYIYRYNNLKKNLYQKFPSVMNIFSFAFILFWVFVIKSSVLDANNIPSPSMVPTLKVGDFLFVNKMRYTLRVPFTDIQLLRFAYPQRGDVITFIPPATASDADGKTFVKRVVGLPGDRIYVEDGTIFVNGKEYPLTQVDQEEFKNVLRDIDFSSRESKEQTFRLFKEQVINPQDGKIVKEHYALKQITADMSQIFYGKLVNEWVVPQGHYFVMGDNRDNSYDSRGWGFVDLKKVEGKVLMVYFSVNWMQSENPHAAEQNVVVNILRSLLGKNQGSYVRWARIGTRIY